MTRFEWEKANRQERVHNHPDPRAHWAFTANEVQQLRALGAVEWAEATATHALGLATSFVLRRDSTYLDCWRAAELALAELQPLLEQIQAARAALARTAQEVEPGSPQLIEQREALAALEERHVSLLQTSSEPVTRIRAVQEPLAREVRLALPRWLEALGPQGYRGAATKRGAGFVVSVSVINTSAEFADVGLRLTDAFGRVPVLELHQEFPKRR